MIVVTHDTLHTLVTHDTTRHARHVPRCAATGNSKLDFPVGSPDLRYFLPEGLDLLLRTVGIPS